MIRKQIWIGCVMTVLMISAVALGQSSFEVHVSGKGKPVILIPGLSSPGSTWDGTVAHLNQRYECHVLSLAGFAGRPPVDAPLLATVEKELVEYVRKNKLEKPVIIGHSLGGYLALKLTAEQPEMFSSAVIVDALPFFAGAANPAMTADGARQMAETMRRQILSGTSAPGFSADQMAATMATKPEDVRRIADWSRASDPKTVASAMYDLFSTDLRGQLPSIRVPVLVLGTWIAYKDYASREQIEGNFLRQYAALPHYRLVLFDTARHFLMWDDPERFFREVDDFLAAGTIR